MANPTDRAWSEGHKAGANGKADTASPYKKGMAHQAWMQGWKLVRNCAMPGMADGAA